MGARRVVDIGLLIQRGVQTYLARTIPLLWMLLGLGGTYVSYIGGLLRFIAFATGGTVALLSTYMGVSLSFQANTRLAHSLSMELFDSMQLGLRVGAIPGLIAPALALGGMAALQLLLTDTMALCGFSSGSAIVSFHVKVGSGVFAKGSDIGADLVGEMSEKTKEEEQRVFDLQQQLQELENRRLQRVKQGIDSEQDEEAMMEHLRTLEEEMQDIASELHPVNYLDMIGETLTIVAGNCTDYLENVALAISTAQVIGSKAHEAPH